MKNQTFLKFGCALAVLLTTLLANAEEGRYRSDTVSSANSSDYSYAGIDHRFGLGVSTMGSHMTPGPAALTGWIGLTPDFGIQPLADIAGTSGVFNFAVGALFKYTLARTSAAGFHIGAGVTFGSSPTGLTTTTVDANGNVIATPNTAFRTAIAGFFGFHFTIPGTSNIVAHLDGGPVLTIFNGTTNMTLESVSPALGLSIIYLF